MLKSENKKLPVQSCMPNMVPDTAVLGMQLVA